MVTFLTLLITLDMMGDEYQLLADGTCRCCVAGNGGYVGGVTCEAAKVPELEEEIVRDVAR